MKIKSRLNLGIIISVILMISLTFFILTFSRQMNDNHNQYVAAMDLKDALAEMNFVMVEYFLHHEERMEQQWNLLYSSNAERIEQSDDELFDLIGDVYAGVGESFSDISETYEERMQLIRDGGSQDDIDVNLLLEERLVAKLLVDSQSIITDASIYASEALAIETRARGLAQSSSIILMLILVTSVTFTSLAVNRSISKPLDELIQGIQIIGSGNSVHRIDYQSDDEIGELASAFNDMADELSARESKLTDYSQHLEERVEEQTEEIRKRENALRDIERKLQESLRATDSGSWDWNITTNEMWWSEGIEKLFGLEHGAQAPSYEYFTSLIHDGDRDRVSERRNLASGEETPYTIDYRTNVKQGGERWVAEKGVVIRSPDAKSVRMMGTVTDITERRRLEEELVQSERLAAIGRIASTVSHEIRNPLGTIKNSIFYINMKLGDQAEERIQRHLHLIDQEVERSTKIIEDLLDFARGPKDPVLIPADMNSIIEDALARVEFPENITVTTKYGDLPIFPADPEQLLRVLLNLISNGVEAMPEGGRLTVETMADGDSVVIGVSDQGDGIPAENLEMLFTPLFSTKTKGVGLGLFITKNIVEAHGGSIGVESKVGEGTKFTISLPIQRAS